MQLKEFNSAFDATRAILGKVDALVKDAGEHFNEAQVEQAEGLVDEFKKAADKASDAAGDALDTIEHEEVDASKTAEDDDDEDDDDDLPDIEGATFQTKDGREFVVVKGKPVFVPKAADADVSAVIAQGSVLDGHDDPMTREAVRTINAAMDKASVKSSGKNPGVTAIQTGNVVDKTKLGDKAAGGDAVEQATSEGDLQTHHTDDGSRTITDAAPTEAVKVLMPDTPTQGGPIDAGTNDKTAAMLALEPDAGSANMFTQSPTADGAADTAAVDSGIQEVIPVASQPGGTTGVTVAAVKVNPADAGGIEHPGYAGENAGTTFTVETGDATKAGESTLDPSYHQG